MNRVNRVDSDVSWYQCSIFDVDPSNRAKRSIIRRELAWRVTYVEDIGDIQGAQLVEAFTRGKSSNEEVLRHAEQCRISIGRGVNSVAERRTSPRTANVVSICKRAMRSFGECHGYPRFTMSSRPNESSLVYQRFAALQKCLNSEAMAKNRYPYEMSPPRSMRPTSGGNTVSDTIVSSNGGASSPNAATITASEHIRKGKIENRSARINRPRQSRVRSRPIPVTTNASATPMSTTTSSVVAIGYGRSVLSGGKSHASDSERLSKSEPNK